jgi:fructosamine-3-kinase
VHLLEQPENVAAIESAVSAHVGSRWSPRRFRILDDRASHLCGIHYGDGFDVFTKFTNDADGAVQFELECRGLRVLHDHGARTAEPIGGGVVRTSSGTLLLLEALPERAPKERTPSDWRAIGRALGELHGVHSDTFGLAGLDGYFGPLPQDNRPVASNRWIDFFRERRVTPLLDMAVRSCHLPAEFVPSVHRFIGRMPALVGLEPAPTLLHGDAQQNNYLSTDDGAVFVDASPFFGHPENDLAMIDIFEPVPNEVFDGYRDVRLIDAEFVDRKELWRIPVYLAIVAVGEGDPFGRTFVPRLADALRSFT